MATIQELSAKVDELQVALDAEQQQIADVLAANQKAIADLQATIDQLNAVVASSATPEQLQAVSDKIDAVIVDLQGTVTP